MRNSKHASSRLFTYNHPQSAISETFRTLRTNIYFSFKEKSSGVIMITSARSGEGKSLITANLAVAMAQAGNKVLIVDSDMRNPTIHDFFSMDNDFGLTNLLIGGVELGKVARATSVEGLKLIPSGPTPSNPSELLDSSNMKTFLEQVRTQYDTVLLDMPPVLAVTDAVLLAPLVDGVLLVVKSGSTGISKVKQAKSHLERANAKIIGAVINEVKMNKSDLSYYNYQRKREHIKQGKINEEIGAYILQVAASKDK